MFEHIHFQYIKFDMPYNGKNTERQLEKYGLLEESLQMEDFYKEHIDEVDFSLEGEARNLFPPPLSSTAKENLLYLQVFGLMDAGVHFFTKRKNYPSYLLLYTYDGVGKLEYDETEYPLEKDCGFLIDCRKEHVYYTAGTHWDLSILHFNGHSADILFQQFYQDQTPIFQTSRTSAYQQNLENLLLSCQDVSRFREFDTSLLLEKLILEIIKEKYKDDQNVPEYIIYLKKYMENHFDSPLSLDELSAFTNISKYHLAREFKRYTGFTINEYLIALRLERAKFLLSNTGLPLGQISQTVGFSNYSNFYKLFCRDCGISPSEYRGMPL